MSIRDLPLTTDDVILDALPPAEIYRYSRTCKTAYVIAQSYIRRRFCIDNILGLYFSEKQIIEFRHLQFHTGMIISGSTALQFFNRLVYDDSDLDIYVDHRHRESVAIWLRDIGYIFKPTKRFGTKTLEEAIFGLSPFEDNTGLQYWGAMSLLNFEKESPQRKIQLITTDGTPITTVLNFHSTCVMNIITHDKAYSLFPRATYDGDNMRSLRTPSAAWHSYTRKALQKYASRGWEILEDASLEDCSDPNSAFPQGLRHIGDSKCWTITISPDIGLPTHTHVELNSWLTEYDEFLRPEMEFKKIAPGTVLKFGFVCPPDDQLWAFVCTMLDKAEAQQSGEQELYARYEKHEESYASVLKWYFDIHSN